MKIGYKIYYFGLIMCIIGIFFGMYFVLEEKDIEIKEIRQVVLSSIDDEEVEEDDFTKLRKLYNINKYEISDFIYYPPKTNMDASEILIIKPKDKQSLSSIEEKINKRIDTQSNSFKNYDMEQYEILTNHVLKEKGDYCILIVNKDSKTIEKNIDELFK